MSFTVQKLLTHFSLKRNFPHILGTQGLHKRKKSHRGGAVFYLYVVFAYLFYRYALLNVCFF